MSCTNNFLLKISRRLLLRLRRRGRHLIANFCEYVLLLLLFLFTFWWYQDRLLELCFTQCIILFHLCRGCRGCRSDIEWSGCHHRRTALIRLIVRCVDVGIIETENVLQDPHFLLKRLQGELVSIPHHILLIELYLQLCQPLLQAEDLRGDFNYLDGSVAHYRIRAGECLSHRLVLFDEGIELGNHEEEEI